MLFNSQEFILGFIPVTLAVFFMLGRFSRSWSLGWDDEQSFLPKALLVVGIAFNVAFLGYFKYMNFLRGTANDVFGTNFLLFDIILPLGISFITFQKIAFLVDVYSRRVKQFTFQDYALFVLFFPQLIAGPIVHFREVMPQFHSASCRFDAGN